MIPLREILYSEMSETRALPTFGAAPRLC